MNELTLEENLVWVCASPRSGTTWLSKDLLSYNTLILDEFHLDEHLAIPTVGVFDTTFKRRIDRHANLESYLFSDKYKSTWLYYLRKLVLNRIYSQFQDLTKKIIIKDPGNVGAYDITSQCFKNSRFIILLRDGRDIIDSLVDALGDDGFISKGSDYVPITQEKRLAFIELRAKLWNNLTEILMRTYENHEPKLRTIIKYEELIQNTFGIVKNLYEFLGVRINDDILQQIVNKTKFQNIPIELRGKTKFYRSATPGKFREHFNNMELDIMNEIMKNSLNKLGYL